MTLIDHSEKVFVMKVFLTVLVLIFSLQSWTKADDIRDFQIAGLSVQDSLLDFINKEKIIARKNSYKDKGYMFRLKDFYSLTFYNKNTFPKVEKFKHFPGLENYDDIQFVLKDADNNFKLHLVSGGKYFYSMEKCFKKYEEIESELNSLFKNVPPRRSNYRHASGKAQVKSTEYIFKDGFVRLACQDWDENSNIQDALIVMIQTMKLSRFFEKNYK